MLVNIMNNTPMSQNNATIFKLDTDHILKIKNDNQGFSNRDDQFQLQSNEIVIPNVTRTDTGTSFNTTGPAEHQNTQNIFENNNSNNNYLTINTGLGN